MVALGLGLGVTFRGSGGFSPASLFAAGEQGAWYDPSDFSTMFQDSAGTTPVTATGQTVGKILDKSGRGNHATQVTAAYRPTLQQDASGFYYLDFDGSNDIMATASVDFSATAKMSLFAGIRQANSTTSVAVELSDISDSNNGTFFLVTASGLVRYRSKGTTAQEANNSVSEPATYVAAMLADIGAPSIIPRLNGTAGTTVTASQGTGNYGNYPINLGARGSGPQLYWTGRLYQLIIRGAASTALETNQAEIYVGNKCGISIAPYVPPSTGNFLLLTDGSSKLLLVDGTSRLQLN